MTQELFLPSLKFLNIYIFFLHFTVPNQTPTIVKAYVTSATSIRVSWKAVDEAVAGYQVAYRSSSSGEWNSVFTAPHMLSLQLENLIAGDVYRVKLAAFNSSGNGIPSKGVEIRMEEGGKLNFLLQMYKS